MIGSPIGAAIGAGLGGVPSELDITDTDVLQLPVDYWIEKCPPYREVIRTSVLAPLNMKSRTTVRGSRNTRLAGGPASFTTRTDSRGYD